MNVEEVTAAILKVIREVQATSGRPCDELTADTVPIGDLMGFDSLSGIEATVGIEAELGEELGTDNVFVGEVKGHKKALTVAQVAQRIVEMLGTAAV